MAQRRPIRRRLRATAMTAAVGLLGATVPAAQVAAVPEGVQPLIHYSFDEAPEGATTVDESGNGYDGVLHRSGAEVEGGVLRLPGGSASSAPYVEVPADGLVGRRDLTISVWLASRSGPANTSAAFIGAPVADGEIGRAHV